MNIRCLGKIVHAIKGYLRSIVMATISPIALPCRGRGYNYCFITLYNALFFGQWPSIDYCMRGQGKLPKNPFSSDAEQDGV